MRLWTIGLAAGLLLRLASGAAAQAVATGMIRGIVQSPDGVGLDGAPIRIVNTSTGFSVTTQVHRAHFLVQGLEVGGPYVVEVRYIGFLPQKSAPLLLTLGEPLELHFVLQPTALPLDTVQVFDSALKVHSGRGTATTIPDALVHRLPTMNRNFYDFVVLAPQVSTKVGFGRTGVVGAGSNLRFNNFQINGAGERFVGGSVSAASNVGKSVPLDAVKEYQVLIAPYDVRYGDFAGALINTVTQSGTNQLRGSGFAYWRNDRLGRADADSQRTPYDRLQYGFSVGGPLLRDRLHFFIAPELQHLAEPAAGPYLGQPAQQLPGVPVQAGDVSRFDAILRNRYGLKAGSGAQVSNGTPLASLFARVDAALPRWNSRALGFVSYNRSTIEQFARSVDSFPLSTYQYGNRVGLGLTSLQLHSDLPRPAGGHNLLSLGLIWDWVDQIPQVLQPLVSVLVPRATGGSVLLEAGTAAQAQGRFTREQSLTLRDELSLPWANRHELVLGLVLERFRISRGGVAGGFGTWTFASLDSLEQGAPERYELQKDFGSASKPLHGGQYSLYAGDEWSVGNGVSLTLGVRADRLALDDRAPYNSTIDSIFGRRTDVMPHAQILLSPRVGFTWNLSSSGTDLIRGGVGMFTGRPPLAWYVPAVANYGEGIGALTCGYLPKDAGPPPVFNPDYRSPPSRCATGPALAARPNGDVDLLDRNLRMARSLRASIAYRRELPAGLLATGEVLLTREVSGFRWVNLNLQGPQSQDRFGRVLYGNILANGVAVPVLRSPLSSEVIELRNTSRNSAYVASLRLERRVGGIGAVLSYTWSRTRDVQSPSRVNQRGIVLWADARAVSGRHDELRREISLNDLPHRVVAALTYAAPWPRWSTELAFYYIGESGSPFTYLATGSDRRGDLNADGSNANDPVYVPANTLDLNEIRFDPFTREVVTADGLSEIQTVTAAAQAEAFGRFIDNTSCLSRQRGRILARNSCREPWSHTTIVSLRQGIPLGSRVVEAQLDLFNLLNLLNGSWGLYRVASPRLLEHVGQQAEAGGTSQPVFRFDPTRPVWETRATESAFQLQLGLRYRF